MTATIPPASRRTLLLGAAGAGLAIPLRVRAQQQYRPEYKVSVVGNRPIPLSDGAFVWADLVRERSGGRINMKVYPGSQLVGGDQTRELVAMRQGVIDMAVFSTINISPQIREMNLFSLPFLLRDHRGFDAVINGEVGQDLFRVLATREVVPVAWGENGFRELSNSRREVRRPEDLRGMKIRFAAGVIFSEIFTALGANPLQMSFADLQPALSTGAVDGQENPVNLFLAFRMDTLAQRHLTIWNYVADAGIFVVAKSIMDGFNAADRALITDAAKDAARQQIANSRRGIGIGGDRSAIEECIRRGVAVAELTPEEKTAFANATRPVFDKWAQTVGQTLVQKAQAAISRATS
ncbi:C4-dicarboxylate ABC transporter [Roseomonas alkaliterrae]|uniref:Tripartite ATP-independent transporter DctP family solute receptor n=1 Tax=Neoroseomonas alkaliterrae TaxID=1452450 RepID=A0A840XX17_9PROT|nr:TRAP transporter substrate-binding protein DctP [Neoroseomonas alkaliterrae]MBB5691159.1 tripartite ATP-independent transporter DctP family solute receptor [Neoroseomonas alkaliterrae]MBR0675497.1 C4-dicarboxylate ABC transporter [Neoroseomonas alkaliterrae]